MIVSVVREHHWTPEVVEKLYLDEQDYEGLEFWYRDGEKVEKEIKGK